MSLERSYAAALAHGYLWHEFGDLHLILPSIGDVEGRDETMTRVNLVGPTINGESPAGGCGAARSSASLTACTPSSPTSSSASRRTCASPAKAPTASVRTSRSFARTAPRCTRPAPCWGSRASGRWPASATTSPRSSCGRSRRSGGGAALPQLGVRVGGARPRTAPGWPLVARCAGTGAAAGALRHSLGLGKEPSIEPVRRRLARSPVRFKIDAEATWVPDSSTKSRRPARSTRSTSRASTASRSRIRRR